MFGMCSDVVLRYGAPSTFYTNTAAAAAAATTAAFPVVPFSQQSGDHTLLEVDARYSFPAFEAGGGGCRSREAAVDIPSTCTYRTIMPAPMTLPAVEFGKESLYLAHLRVALEEAVDSGHLDEPAARTTLLQVANHASREGSSGATPLHVAAALGQEQIVTVLLLKGADVDGIDSNGRTPLHLAVENGHVSTVEVILAANPDTSMRYKEASMGYSVLHLAAREGNVDILRALLQHGVDVNRLVDGYSSLHIAALNNRVGAIDLLVEAGANMEIEDDEDCTPFIIACSHHCHEAALALFNHGARIEARNIQGETSLQIVARQAGREGATATVDLLLRCGGDETAVNRDGQTAAEIISKNTAYTDRPLQKESVYRIRKLLANASADRAWRRRGLLIMYRSIWIKGRFFSTNSSGDGSHTRRMLRDESVPGGSTNALMGERQRKQQQRRVLTSNMRKIRMSVSEQQLDINTAANGFRSFISWVLELGEEGLFRNILAFL